MCAYTVSLHISAAFLNSLHYQGLAHIFVFMRKSAMCQYCSYKLFETTLIFSYFAWKIRDRCSGLMKCANIHGKSKRRKPNLCRILPNLKVWHDQLFFQLSLNSQSRFLVIYLRSLKEQLSKLLEGRFQSSLNVVSLLFFSLSS